jgi:hypothetical protein
MAALLSLNLFFTIFALCALYKINTYAFNTLMRPWCIPWQDISKAGGKGKACAFFL